MSLDEELQKLKREGADPARIIIAKVRAGAISPRLLQLVALFKVRPDVEEAAQLLSIKINFSKLWNAKKQLLDPQKLSGAVISKIVNEIAKVQSSFAGIKKSKDLSRRISTSFACDVAEHVVNQNEFNQNDRSVILDGISQTRKWAAGENIGVGLRSRIAGIISVLADNYISDDEDALHYATLAVYNAMYEGMSVLLTGNCSLVACKMASHCWLSGHPLGVELEQQKINENHWQVNRLIQYALGEI